MIDGNKQCSNLSTISLYLHILNVQYLNIVILYELFCVSDVMSLCCRVKASVVRASLISHIFLVNCGKIDEPGRTITGLAYFSSCFVNFTFG